MNIHAGGFMVVNATRTAVKRVFDRPVLVGAMRIEKPVKNARKC